MCIEKLGITAFGTFEQKSPQGSPNDNPVSDKVFFWLHS